MVPILEACDMRPILTCGTNTILTSFFQNKQAQIGCLVDQFTYNKIKVTPILHLKNDFLD